MTEDLCEGRPKSCFDCPYPDCRFDGKKNGRENMLLKTSRKVQKKGKCENEKVYKICLGTRCDLSYLSGDGGGRDLFIPTSR